MANRRCTETQGPADRSDRVDFEVLTAEDIAFGFPFGGLAGGFPSGPGGGDPMIVLERVIAAAIGSGPCLVSFSGGIDSSLILGAATAVARRIGAPDPVPVTWRFDPSVSEAQESHWQEAVISELGLTDWQRLDAGERLDWLGPAARGFLRRQGVHYPANTFVHAPFADLAKGGSLLTGIGGDQILGLWRGREIAALAARRRGWRAGDPHALISASLPASVRARLNRRRHPVDPVPWLTPPAQVKRRHRAAADDVHDPVSWGAHLRWRWLRRDLQLSLRSLRALECDSGARVVAPFLDPSFVDALAVAGGRLGAGNRSQTITRWLAPALPVAVRNRGDKARFPGIFWRTDSRAGARELITAGRLHDTELIDAAGLTAEWESDHPHQGSALLLQDRWLAWERISHGSDDSPQVHKST